MFETEMISVDKEVKLKNLMFIFQLFVFGRQRLFAYTNYCLFISFQQVLHCKKVFQEE